MTAVAESVPPEASGFDLLRVPILGAFLRWRHARTAFQVPLFAIALVIVLHGLLGPSLAPKNLATLVAWVHYRGLLVLALLGVGNLFCLACPFMLPRELARRFVKPHWKWPRALRSKWLAIGLLVLILYLYELLDLWGAPALTAWLILAYFIGAVVVDGLFKHASFCKWVCPIGQFNFVASTVSPMEIKVRDRAVCSACRTKDCIRGTRDPDNPLRVIQRGCELALFQPRKVGNMDCTFCLDCVHACPHDNIGITTRVPASELWIDPLRSGIGRFSQRPDLALLVIVFVFGALLNAFGMVSPVYALQSWLADVFRLPYEAPILAMLFAVGLIVEPAVLLAGTAWWTRRWTGSREKLLPLAARYAFALVPLGLGVWVAHYCFHLLTGLWTVIPVAQHAVAQLGFPLLGEPQWGVGGFSSARIYPLEIGFLFLGWVGTLLVARRMAEAGNPESPHRAFVPWAALSMLLFSAALWLLSQPMEMRGTFLAS